MICFTGFISFINPDDWPDKAGAASISPPKYKSLIFILDEKITFNNYLS